MTLQLREHLRALSPSALHDLGYCQLGVVIKNRLRHAAKEGEGGDMAIAKGFTYTTNAIESLNAKLRRAVKTRGHFPNDDAAMKLLFLVLRHAAKAWKMQPREWVAAKTQFAIIFEDRFFTA